MATTEQGKQIYFEKVIKPIHWYLSLYSGDPQNNGNECNWKGYSRVCLSVTDDPADAWDITPGFILRNRNTVLFEPFLTENGSESVTVTHWGLWTAKRGGVPVYIVQSKEPSQLFANDVYRVLAGKMSLQLL